MNQYEHDKAWSTDVTNRTILMLNRTSTLRRTCRLPETIAVQALCVFACGLLAAPRDGVNRQNFAPSDGRDDPVALERDGLLPRPGDQSVKRPAEPPRLEILVAGGAKMLPEGSSEVRRAPPAAQLVNSSLPPPARRKIIS